MPPKNEYLQDNFGNTISDHRRGVGLIQARVYSSWSNRWLAREAGTSESVEERMERGTGGGESGEDILSFVQISRYFIKSSNISLLI